MYPAVQRRSPLQSLPLPARTAGLLLAASLLVGACTEATPGREEARPAESAPPTPSPTPSPSSEPAAVGPVERIEAHLRALDRIARRSGGTRAAGSKGYDRSVAYVSRRMRSWGYEIERVGFDFDHFEQLSPFRVESLGPRRVYVDGRDVRAMVYSGSGRVTGPVEPVDFDLHSDEHDGAGCSSDDFSGFPSGAVALVRPGNCYYRDQVVNAQEAGAEAVFISFPEFTRATGVLRPTLLSGEGIEIPALAATDDTGVQLARSRPRVRLRVRTRDTPRRGVSLIAQRRRVDGDVLMVGGHLDSVIDGPGINDNGSGIATILEMARVVGEKRPDAAVRFGFWGGEEIGLLGSTAYVEGLSSEEAASIEAYLNFDMVASPNFVRYVYDDGVAPSGSDAITEVFTRYFKKRGIEFETIDLGGRSDHGAFIEEGIPVGGLFTGAEMLKSRRQRRDYGGRAGESMDSCYHRACDDIDNINEEVLGEMASAIRHALFALLAR